MSGVVSVRSYTRKKPQAFWVKGHYNKGRYVKPYLWQPKR